MIVIGFIYSNLFNQVLLEMKPILRAVVLVLVLPAWHGQWYRRMFGKLGIVVIVGKPNIGKSKEIMTALHMSSSQLFFFAKVNLLCN